MVGTYEINIKATLNDISNNYDDSSDFLLTVIGNDFEINNTAPYFTAPL
jgi:hypothetical protein